MRRCLGEKKKTKNEKDRAQYVLHPHLIYFFLFPIEPQTLERTFSNEAGEMTEKQIRNTSVCGYDSGRRRS